MIDLADKEFPFECWRLAVYHIVLPVTIVSSDNDGFACDLDDRQISQDDLFETKDEAIKEAGIRIDRDIAEYEYKIRDLQASKYTLSIIGRIYD